ncbi:sulfotransferase 2B1-like isoform X2 [Chanodichthys erythropterus]|uniref:sulfotransferase 2B1-like isoform X2 n=1 Tax=Chanodichthys erythropterus TaxID=933992 RepID=UPI00351E6359
MTEAELYSVLKGVYVPTHLHPPESLKYYEEFTFRQDDILIVTYPKSGTTWMQEIVPLIVSEGDMTPVLTVPNWDRVPWLEEHRAMLLSLEQRPSPRVFATHFHHRMMNESYFKMKPRVLYVMRNPKDVFTSSYHYYGMASYLVNPGTQDEFMEKFLDGNIMFGSWFDHVKGWINAEEKESILYIFYEEMIAVVRCRSSSTEKNVFTQCGCLIYPSYCSWLSQTNHNTCYHIRIRRIKKREREGSKTADALLNSQLFRQTYLHLRLTSFGSFRSAS